MKFHSRLEALMVLGLNESADEDAIKSAYKNLVKLYHPDVRQDAASARQYQAISEAYEYLSVHTIPDGMAVWAAAGGDNAQNAGHRIFGTREELNNMKSRMKRREEYARQEARGDINKRARVEELSQKAREARQERVFNEAMDKIHTERAAEVMAQIIQAYLQDGAGK
ncbi:MAG: DnaJ domain-containing protein [Lachnospiraceae bacterium]|nr:DnaJ domain-containing protein [Lachnospiraceae bacterium]